jgi:LacI family transcriptional regulator
MNGSAKVSEKTHKKVTEAITALKYRPNAMARSLALNCSDSVGVLVSELHGPIYGEMMSGIEEQLRAFGKYVIIAAGHSNEESEKGAIEFLISRNCDALILNVEALSDAYLLELSELATPFVLINRVLPALKDKCFSLDNYRGGYIATKSLLEKGHREIAYISGPLWKTDASDRYEGHQGAMAEFGLSCEQALLYEGDFQEQSGSRGLCALLQKAMPFSALVCANDETAVGAMDEARNQGLSIPKDMSIIGFDDFPYAGYLYPRFCTVDYPMRNMGCMAAQWVLKHIYKSEVASINNVFEPQLVWRDSVLDINT